eukprot:7550164-Alexandrium_andersonii.AAC.1
MGPHPRTQAGPKHPSMNAPGSSSPSPTTSSAKTPLIRRRWGLGTPPGAGASAYADSLPGGP